VYIVRFQFIKVFGFRMHVYFIRFRREVSGRCSDEHVCSLEHIDLKHGCPRLKHHLTAAPLTRRLLVTQSLTSEVCWGNQSGNAFNEHNKKTKLFARSKLLTRIWKTVRVGKRRRNIFFDAREKVQ